MGIKIQLCQISIQIQMSPHELKNAKFSNLYLDNQMSGTCGQYEPLFSPWNVFFSFVIVQYFISFLLEHPVYPIHASRLTLLGGEVKVLIWIPYEKASTNQDESDFLGTKRQWKVIEVLQICCKKYHKS